MKPHPNHCQCALAAGLTAMLLLGSPATAAPAARTATPEAVVRSVFTIPSNPREGRDPFFPNSSRPYANTQAVQQVPTADTTSLVLKGVSGPTGSRLAIINNRTFAVGDEQDIVSSQGRMRVRCLEIRTDSVVIEVSGQRLELKYVENQ
jgi:hypothetical protein